MFGGVRGWLSLCAATLMVGAAIGCADDEGESTANERSVLNSANEAPKVFVERLAKLLETSTRKEGCTPLDDVTSRSVVGFPCPTPQALRKSMASFKLMGVEQHGSGVVADYKSGTAKDGAAILLYVAPDNNWGVSRFGMFTEPSVGTDDAESRDGYDKVLAKYLTAVRERDCKAFTAVKFVASQGVDACKTLFPKTKKLGRRLDANPSVQPVYQGGNGTYGFYALETKKPEPQMWTVSVVRNGDPSKTYAVLDAAPSPTAAQQRNVRRQLEERLNSDPSQPETSESRKAD